MGHAIFWLGLGYASCVWDCSSNPVDTRWPSATGVFVLLMALRSPRFSLCGAALCGLILDAAHGGPLGPRVIAGVIANGLACQWGISRAETSWVRAAVVTAAAIAIWLAAPALSSELNRSDAWAAFTSIAMKTFSTSLISLAIRSVIRPIPRFDHQD